MVDLDNVFLRFKLWQAFLPRIKPFYAIKSNNDNMIVKLLSHIGVNFDCASKGEIEQVLELGVSPTEIVYANPCKQDSSLRFAFEKGVDLMTFDNELELYKIRDNHPNAKCLLRIKTDDSKSLHKLSTKFGADEKTSLLLIKKAQRLRLDLVGIAFHVGCSNMNACVFREEIRKSRELFDYALNNFGIEMNVLDIGGGFLGSQSQSDNFKEFAQQLNRIIDEFFPHSLLPSKNLRIIAEPGRFFCESSQTLCSKVIAKRVLTNEVDNIHMYYYLNCGFFSGLMDICMSDEIEKNRFPFLLSRKTKDLTVKKDTLFLSTVWGPTCDQLDVVFKNKLMIEYEISDHLLFKDMGAYSNSIVTKFNSFPVPSHFYAGFQLYDEYKSAFE